MANRGVAGFESRSDLRKAVGAPTHGGTTLQLISEQHRNKTSWPATTLNRAEHRTNLHAAGVVLDCVRVGSSVGR